MDEYRCERGHCYEVTKQASNKLQQSTSKVSCPDCGKDSLLVRGLSIKDSEALKDKKST